MKKTFTAGDVIRIFCNNITSKEQTEVLMFFWLIFPGIFLDNDQTEAILTEGLELTPKGFRLMIIFVRIFARKIRGFLARFWTNLLIDLESTKKVIFHCIEKRLAGQLVVGAKGIVLPDQPKIEIAKPIVKRIVLPEKPVSSEPPAPTPAPTPPTSTPKPPASAPTIPQQRVNVPQTPISPQSFGPGRTGFRLP